MKKHIKSIVILTITDIVVFIGGIVADIIFWSYAYNHRAPDEVGHGVPVFSALGVILVILITAIYSIICVIIYSRKRRKNREKKQN